MGEEANLELDAPNGDVATIEAPVVEFPCAECGQDMGEQASFCRHCGYYPKIGTCVDVADWETDFENGEYVGAEPEQLPAWRSIPEWSWQLAAGLVVVVAISVAGSILTPEGSPVRTSWALGQTGLGLLVFLAAHLRVGIRALSEDRDLGLLDLATSPFRIWIGAAMDYPRSFRWVVVGLGGFVAIVMAHAVLGIPYSELINLDAKPVVKEERKSPVAAMAKMGGGGSKDMTLEEAMEEFAGDSGAGALAEAAENPLQEEEDEEKEVRTRELNAIVVGCIPASPDDPSITGIVAAVKMNGKWASVGVVSDGVTPEVGAALQSHVQRLRTAKPFVRCRETATWLKPRVRCRIEVKYSEGDDEPQHIRLLNLL